MDAFVNFGGCVVNFGGFSFCYLPREQYNLTKKKSGNPQNFHINRLKQFWIDMWRFPNISDTEYVCFLKFFLIHEVNLEIYTTINNNFYFLQSFTLNIEKKSN